jgi:hypothetical protein
MNIVFVVVIAIGGILFSLYAIAPPEGMDLGAVKQELADMGETQQQSGGVLSTIELADSFTSTTQDVLTDATSVDEATRNEAQEHLSKAREELAKAKELLQDVA